MSNLENLMEESIIMPPFIENLMEDLEKEFPGLNRIEYYKLALEVERNWLLKAGLGVDHDDPKNHPAFLEHLLMKQDYKKS